MIKMKFGNKKSSIEVFTEDGVANAINPFLANVPISYPLKTPENLWFSGVFRGYEMGTLTRNGLRIYLEARQVFQMIFQPLL